VALPIFTPIRDRRHPSHELLECLAHLVILRNAKGLFALRADTFAARVFVADGLSALALFDLRLVDPPNWSAREVPGKGQQAGSRADTRRGADWDRPQQQRQERHSVGLQRCRVKPHHDFGGHRAARGGPWVILLSRWLDAKDLHTKLRVFEAYT
jgi:hypothetical protein